MALPTDTSFSTPHYYPKYEVWLQKFFCGRIPLRILLFFSKPPFAQGKWGWCEGSCYEEQLIDGFEYCGNHSYCVNNDDDTRGLTCQCGDGFTAHRPNFGEWGMQRFDSLTNLRWKWVGTLCRQAEEFWNKGRIPLPNRMNFLKSVKGGGGSFSIQKFMLQILGPLNRAF